MNILTEQAQIAERRIKLRLAEIDSDEQMPPKPIPSLKEVKKAVWEIIGSNASNYHKARDDYYKNKKSNISETT